jgi:hypothetical protein
MKTLIKLLSIFLVVTSISFGQYVVGKKTAGAFVSDVGGG